MVIGRIDFVNLARWSPPSRSILCKVYVLRRGLSSQNTTYDVQDRDMWHMGTVTAAVNGRFTVKYDQEEGSPQEARIAPDRIRTRQIIRQKVAEKVRYILFFDDGGGKRFVF